MNSRLDSKHWTEYWKSGNKTTFNSQFNDGYDGEIKSFWKSIFYDLKTGDSIADFCCGSGALINLVIEFASENSLDINICGIDYADISVDRIKRLPNILPRIIANTSVEHSGLADSSIDLIISQYGIEYTDIDLAIKEASRICKAKGKMVFIAHTEESKIIKEASTNIEQIDYCTKRLKIAANVRRMLLVLEDKAKADLSGASRKKADKLRTKINRDLVGLNTIITSNKQSTFVKYFVNQLMGVFESDNGKVIPMIEKLKMVDSLLQEIDDYRLRLSDLLGAALSKEMQSKLKQVLTSNGFRVDVFESIYYQTNNIGIKVVASK